jgi:hypothetical protein
MFGPASNAYAKLRASIGGGVRSGQQRVREAPREGLPCLDRRGVFGPASNVYAKLRALVTAHKTRPTPACPGAMQPVVPHARRLPWADLLRRVFARMFCLPVQRPLGRHVDSPNR